MLLDLISCCPPNRNSIATFSGRAPVLGLHTAEILEELGLDAGEVEAAMKVED